MNTPYQDMAAAMEKRRRLNIEEVRHVLGSHNLKNLTDREEDSLNRAFLDFRAIAAGIVEKRGESPK